MAEYIDREALGIGKANRDVFEVPEYADGWNAAIEIIENAPAADMVEVVRCKDCVYWEDGGYDGRCEAYQNGLIRDYTNYDDFCSYGERKTDENL